MHRKHGLVNARGFHILQKAKMILRSEKCKGSQKPQICGWSSGVRTRMANRLKSVEQGPQQIYDRSVLCRHPSVAPENPVVRVRSRKAASISQIEGTSRGTSRRVTVAHKGRKQRSCWSIQLCVRAICYILAIRKDQSPQISTQQIGTHQNDRYHTCWSRIDRRL